MKILMLTPYLPYPPSSGGQVRSYNLLKHLGKKHEISLVSLIKTDEEKQFVDHLKDYCKKIYVCKRSESPWTFKNITQSIFGYYPFLIVRNLSSEAKKIISHLIETNKYDLIHAETFYIMPHIPETHIPILLVEQTIEYRVYQHFIKSIRFPLLKILFYLDIVKLKIWEKKYWKKADLVVAVSETDKNKMHELLPDLTIKIIPNGAGEDLIGLFQKEKKVDKPIFLYQGNFSWLQNVEAAEILARSIFPRIKRKIPQSICVITGQKAQEKISYLKKHEIKIIDIMSSQTEQVKKGYQEASVFLAPIKGPGGTRLKILGAMAAGLPVISSQVGIEGLDVTDNENILIAKNEDEFVQKTVNLLNNQALYNKIRINARKLIDEKYNWQKISKDLEKIYLGLKKIKRKRVEKMSI